MFREEPFGGSSYKYREVQTPPLSNGPYGGGYELKYVLGSSMSSAARGFQFYSHNSGENQPTPANCRERQPFTSRQYRRD